MSRRPPRRVPRMARTLWSLSVLALLRERPMHPYELQRQMHLRHTDERLGLKRGSLYHAINQLQRDGLIEPIETSRAGRRPERTVYQITRDGEEELHASYSQSRPSASNRWPRRLEWDESPADSHHR